MEAKASKHTWVGGGKQQLSEHQRINKVSDPQVIGENPRRAGAPCEASAEVLVGPPGRMVSK
jgi:hypothetical protein